MRLWFALLGLLAAGACGGESPHPAATGHAASAQFTFAGALSGSLSNLRIAECVPGSFSFQGEVAGAGVSVLVRLSDADAKPGIHPAVSAAGHPLVSLASVGNLGPTGSATGGKVTVGPDSVSGSLDVDVALTRGGVTHLAGSWSC